MSAIKKWSIDKITSRTKEKEPRSYKSHNSAKVNGKSLSDVDDSYDEEDNVSDFGNTEILFLFNSK